MIAKCHQQLYLAYRVGLSISNYLFHKLNYSQLVRTRLQDHPSECGFYTIFAAFLLFKFEQEKITGVHDVNVLSFKGTFVIDYQIIVNVEFVQRICSVLEILIKFF